MDDIQANAGGQYRPVRKTRILISVPNTGWVHKHVAIVLLRLIQDRRYDTHIILPTHNPYENNLHHIVRDFLEGDFDFWLSFDSDNPPIQNPLDLVEDNLDIVGFPTPIFHNDIKNRKPKDRPVYWSAYKYVPEKDAYTEWPTKEGLQKVDAIGTGCFLIARRVFENPEMQKGAFTRKLNPDGTVHKGNDISFCERARENGFEIYSHFDYPCMHFKEIELSEMVGAFKNLYET